MSLDSLQERLSAALRSAASLPEDHPVQWQIPKRSDQGDLATNLAMTQAKQLGKSPRAIAEEWVQAVDWDEIGLEKVEVAGPGFINVWVGLRPYQNVVREILNKGDEYGENVEGTGRKVLVEFVSANPTGPVNVVSARAAAIGDSLVRVMKKAGYVAFAEFYVNDAGRQIRRLGASVIARANGNEPPEDGYHGEDVSELAKTLYPNGASSNTDPEEAGRKAAELNLKKQQAALEAFDVTFDRWFRETELHASDAPMQVLNMLKDKGAVEEKDGALWFKGSEYGDEDRVIVTSEGRPTYLLPDIAYHLDKIQKRGNDLALDLLGPDHLDYVGRMKAALKVFGYEEAFDAIIVQQVHLIEDGKKVKMSKRAGKLITLQELVDEVGTDVARYFFLQRRTSTPLEFDLDLAKEQSDRNPVFYVQYAHTRISSILRQKGCPEVTDATDLSYLKEPEELDLIKHLEQFGVTIQRAAQGYEPQKLVGYLHDLATTFHKFYTACRVIGDDEKVSAARAALVKAAQIVLAEGLRLLGVSAPEQM